MARAKHLLSARRVTALLKNGHPRRHADGGSLYLQDLFACLRLWFCKN